MARMVEKKIEMFCDPKWIEKQDRNGMQSKWRLRNVIQYNRRSSISQMNVPKQSTRFEEYSSALWHCNEPNPFIPNRRRSLNVNTKESRRNSNEMLIIAFIYDQRRNWSLS